MSDVLTLKPSWKNKIDPAFDKIIRFYVEFIGLVGLPANTGWIRLEDEPLKLWENKGMQGWIKKYEKNMTLEKNTIIKWKVPKNITVEEFNKAKRDFEKDLLEEIKILPHDSQEYYKKAFAPFYSDTISDNYFKSMTTEKLKELYTDFIADTYLLEIHRSSIEIKEEFEHSRKVDLEKRYVRQSMIFNIIFSIYNSIALLVFEKTLTDLIKEARNGDKKSFFNLLRIDRTVIECEWAQKMVRKAQLTGDHKFFKQMAKAISKSPIENAKEYTTARMVILLFWGFGLRKLEYPEMIDVIEACGIKLQESPEAFERFVRRLTSGKLKDIVTFTYDKQVTP